MEKEGQIYNLRLIPTMCWKKSWWLVTIDLKIIGFQDITKKKQINASKIYGPPRKFAERAQ